MKINNHNDVLAKHTARQIISNPLAYSELERLFACKEMSTNNTNDTNELINFNT